MAIRTVTTSLSDGSEVTDVVFQWRDAGGQYRSLIFPACSPNDASEFVSKIEAAIAEHTIFEFRT